MFMSYRIAGGGSPTPSHYYPSNTSHSSASTSHVTTSTARYEQKTSSSTGSAQKSASNQGSTKSSAVSAATAKYEQSSSSRSPSSVDTVEISQAARDKFANSNSSGGIGASYDQSVTTVEKPFPGGKYVTEASTSVGQEGTGVAANSKGVGITTQDGPISSKLTDSSIKFSFNIGQDRKITVGIGRVEGQYIPVVSASNKVGSGTVSHTVEVNKNDVSNAVATAAAAGALALAARSGSGGGMQSFGGFSGAGALVWKK